MSEAGTEPGMSMAEAQSLGRELARVYKRAVATYQRIAQVSPEKAVAGTDELLAGTSLEDVMEQDPEEISWLDLDSLADTGDSLQAWERIKEEAGKELSLGGTVAKLLVSEDAKPWEHAQFYALRRGMMLESSLGVGWKWLSSTHWHRRCGCTGSGFSSMSSVPRHVLRSRSGT
jgi:hypothetical protein